MEIYEATPLNLYSFPYVQQSEYLIKSFQITLLLRIYILHAGVISLTGMKSTNSELSELYHTLFSLIVKAFPLPLTIYSLGFLLQINKCQDIHAVHINILKALYVNLILGLYLYFLWTRKLFFFSLGYQFIISSKFSKLIKSHDKTKQSSIVEP